MGLYETPKHTGRSRWGPVWLYVEGQIWSTLRVGVSRVRSSIRHGECGNASGKVICLSHETPSTTDEKREMTLGS